MAWTKTCAFLVAACVLGGVGGATRVYGQPGGKPPAPPAPTADGQSGGAGEDGSAGSTAAGRQGESGDQGSVDPSTLQYRELIEVGLREFSAGNWPEAIRMFEAAHAANPNARTLRGLGHAHFENRSYVQAVHYLAEALKSQRRPLTPSQRKQTERVLARAERFVVHLTLEVVPESAEVFVDGYPAQYDEEGKLLVDPGERSFSVQARGYRTRNMQFDVLPGHDGKLPIELSPLPDPVAEPSVPAPTEGEVSADLETYSPPPVSLDVPMGTWILGGVGAGLLIGSAITGAQAASIHSELEDDCPGDVCPQSAEGRISDGETLATVTNVLLVGGALSLTASLAWWLIDWQTDTPPSTMGGLSCTAEGCTAGLLGKF